MYTDLKSVANATETEFIQVIVWSSGYDTWQPVLQLAWSDTHHLRSGRRQRGTWMKNWSKSKESNPKRNAVGTKVDELLIFGDNERLWSTNPTNTKSKITSERYGSSNHKSAHRGWRRFSRLSLCTAATSLLFNLFPLPTLQNINRNIPQCDTENPSRGRRRENVFISRRKD